MTFKPDRLRRTMMFVPGNNAGMLKDAGIYGADSIMFDLEDSVSLAEKDSARILVYEALQTVDYGDTELVVRINGLDTEFYQADIKAMVKAGIDVIRIPKVENAGMVEATEKLVADAEAQFGIPVGTTHVMAAIESAEGVLNVSQIAKASDRMIGVALSAEDYTTDMQTHRYPGGKELEFARNMIINAARAAHIAAFDTVYTNVDNVDGLIEETEFIHQLGYDGKSVINPRQIPVINKVFEPSETEVKNAQNVIAAIERAHQAGSGVIAMNGQMVDRPVVLRAERVMKLAKASGIVDKEGHYIGK
ncbi:citrate (pro-3S)-lyase subunit beta [Fructilactobacillus ixorae]|uniref:Citrate lyase subunit beta n=2 Tax=Fructilactobacillus TaxID=2767881 RepID=A0ABY5BN05_9LACO|nr:MULTISPECIES: citrate (pro-3S)-lyase subunit beta [Fructilactobacillus]USS84625.1 citrate (pro-3S)-lyase subunit beta [Fructilactobacillus myrtifloralis]USS93286.1 citrate (pro-3S)-lyase subunit beta [Fructilactobacillus ixorae]